MAPGHRRGGRGRSCRAGTARRLCAQSGGAAAIPAIAVVTHDNSTLAQASTVNRGDSGAAGCAIR